MSVRLSPFFFFFFLLLNKHIFHLLTRRRDRRCVPLGRIEYPSVQGGTNVNVARVRAHVLSFVSTRCTRSSPRVSLEQHSGKVDTCCVRTVASNNTGGERERRDTMTQESNSLSKLLLVNV